MTGSGCSHHSEYLASMMWWCSVRALDYRWACIWHALTTLGSLQVSDWDGSLMMAKQKLFEFGQMLMQGDETVQRDFDRWDQIANNHPETIEQKKAEAIEWDRVNRPLCLQALATMRGFIPGNIASTSAASMLEQGQWPNGSCTNGPTDANEKLITRILSSVYAH